MTGESRDDGLVRRLLDTHPAFTSARDRVLAVLTRGSPALDDLVAESRTPVRTTLLVLHDLCRAGRLLGTPGAGLVAEAAPGGVRPGAGDWDPPPRVAGWRERYLARLENREDPGLLWGQRRLTPRSAMDRAAYVLSLLDRSPADDGVVFLGDDDLVSPLVAAASGRRVSVIDIDRAVIERVREVTVALGSRVAAWQADLSLATGLEDVAGDSGMVVCDPFPSGDGSFESMFWSSALRLLRPGGLLVTTVAPSHKPEGYARGALARLAGMGLQLIDLRADFGRYEVFDFELVAVERSFAAEHGLVATVSHTKSLLAARHTGEVPGSADDVWSVEGQENVRRHDPVDPGMDFARWSAATERHYLTGQAGLRRQREIVEERGTSAARSPAPARAEPAVCRGTSPEGWLNTLLDRYPGTINDAEARAIRRFREAGGASLAEESDWPDLALRAIESWSRWRLDG